MDWLEIAVPRANGEAVFWPDAEKSAFRVKNVTPLRIGKNNRRRREKILDVDQMSAEHELIKLENQWADAWVKSDAAFFERIMSDDYTWTAPEGYVCTKADNIALAKSGEDVVASLVLADMKVRVYGDAAVVTGCQTIKETYKGEDVSGQERWTHTWVRRSGRWQCVAAHSSLIAQK